jgi:Rieske 2Fe-2S family protein
MDSLAALVAARRPGHALPQGFYLRDDVFARDMRWLLGRWTCAGHVSEIAEAGDWITAELGDESAIIARGEDGVMRAMANVCRHRGSRICVGARGTAAALVCPYHAWSYRLDGRLRAAREMPAGFDPSAHGLKALPLAVIGGLIFVSFDDNPPDLSVAEPALAAFAATYGWPTAKIAHRQMYRVAANWKLALENYHECYHCGPAHPEFAVLHTLARPGARTLITDPGGTRTDTEDWGPEPNGRELLRVMRSGLSDGADSGSADGKSVAPAMGPADGHCVFAELGPLSAFLAYADYGVIYRFVPRGMLDTQMEVIWLVADDAVEGRDYDVARLTWLWDVTSQADKRIIETNQAGVSSRHFVPGPFSPMEPGTQDYVERYVNEFRATP